MGIPEPRLPRVSRTGAPRRPRSSVLIPTRQLPLLGQRMYSSAPLSPDGEARSRVFLQASPVTQSLAKLLTVTATTGILLEYSLRFSLVPNLLLTMSVPNIVFIFSFSHHIFTVIFFSKYTHL